ncbi:MAG: N-acetylmuramic acid 6-phosphate etherase [Aggregatilineales bacterium]
MLTEQANPGTQDIDKLDTLAMVQRINEQDKTVAEAVEKALPQIANAIDVIVRQLQGGGRLIYLGAGTSGRLGILDAVECVPTYGTPPERVQGILAGGDKAIKHSVEGAEDEFDGGRRDLEAIHFSAQDVLVGIAASGRTPYVLGAIAYAQSLTAPTIGIACNVPSALLDAADIAIGVAVGAEVIAGSTRMKAGTAQKMVMNMLSTGSMIKLGKVYGNLMVDVQVTNEKLAQRARSLIMQIADVDEVRADVLLAESGNQVKTAIVMAKRNVNVEDAAILLKEANGFLRVIID